MFRSCQLGHPAASSSPRVALRLSTTPPLLRALVGAGNPNLVASPYIRGMQPPTRRSTTWTTTASTTYAFCRSPVFLTALATSSSPPLTHPRKFRQSSRRRSSRSSRSPTLRLCHHRRSRRRRRRYRRRSRGPVQRPGRHRRSRRSNRRRSRRCRSSRRHSGRRSCRRRLGSLQCRWRSRRSRGRHQRQ